MPRDADKPIRLLHLSDTQFRADQTWDSDPVKRDLARFIGTEIRQGLVPDLVAITGDLAFTGKPEEYALARQWLEDALWPALTLDASKPLPLDRLLLVPGNHDGDRGRVGQGTRHIQAGLLAAQSQDAIAEILGDQVERDFLLRRYAAYLDFYGRWQGQPQQLPWWERLIQIRGQRLHIAGLDSAWMASGDTDRGRLLLGRYQINQTAMHGLSLGADWRLALLHHPWDYLAEFDARDVRKSLHLHRDLILRGHLHEVEAFRVVPADPERACLELAAGCVYETSRYPNTFQWVELNPDPKRMRVLFRVWIKGAWAVDRNQPGCPDGEATFDLSSPRPRTTGKAPKSLSVAPRKYLEGLWSDTAHIDIRGLVTGRSDAHRFPIEDLYVEIPVTETLRGTEATDIHRGRTVSPNARTSSPLRQALSNPRLVITGDPGSGKTTFLRWVAHCLAADRLGRDPGAAARHLGLDKARLPVMVPIADWLAFIETAMVQKTGPALRTASDWLPFYLGARATDANEGLGAKDFRSWLDAGEALILLDGLDEAPDRLRRKQAVILIEQLAQTWNGCALAVTSRPTAYQGIAGFAHTHIEALDAAAIDGFLARWSRALFPERPDRAAVHHRELAAALASSREIRQLDRNLAMLTALAVAHRNDKRLPEMRAELYESILHWLLEAREWRPGREKAQRRRQLLAELALAMQGDGRVQVTRRWAAERIAARFGAPEDPDSIARAEDFLAEEEIDSGILVRRGHQLCFWHLTFQEYLGALALAGRRVAERTTLLLDSTQGATPPLYRPEWRETVLLLGGLLYLQGPDSVDGLVAAVLDALDGAPAREAQMRAAGLLGALMRDLAPFGYRPADPRYGQLLNAALAVFDPEQAPAIHLQDRIAVADALAQTGDPRLDWMHPGRWVELPSGPIRMGAQSNDQQAEGYDPEASGNESPVHLVVLSGFRISTFPVTVAEYAQFLADEDSRAPSWWVAGGADQGPEPDAWEDQQAHPNRPVVQVSWHQAMAFCTWLSDRLGWLSGAKGSTWLPPGVVVRLPTEAEWEYAARGKQGRRYPWGDDPPDPERTNWEQSKVGDSCPVGIFTGDRTPEGVSDMAGNVSEWCFDAYVAGFYEQCRRQGSAVDPVATDAGGAPRVLRGGAFDGRASQLRGSYRGGVSSEHRGIGIGFRCVLAPPRGDLALAQRQAWELTEMARAGQFASVVDLQGHWLTGVEGADPLLLRLREVARFLQAAGATTILYHRLKHLDNASKALTALRGQRQAARGPLADSLVPVLDAWEAVLRKHRDEAEVVAANQLPNPFCAGNPLTPEQGLEVFRGRDALVRTLDALLADPGASVSVALIGPRRCGKTSLLRMLPVLLPDTICIFFDLQDHPLDSPAAFFRELASEAGAQAQRDRQLLLPRLPDGPPFKAGSQWLGSLEEVAGDGRILLCIDEFERLETLFPGNRRALLKLMGLFRATIQHRRRVRLLVAGAAPFDELDAMWNDHFVNVRELRVGHLDSAIARELLTRPLQDFPAHAIPVSVAQEIVARTGGQPYLLQLYGSLLITRINAEEGRSAILGDVHVIENSVLSQAAYYFRNLYQSAPESARTVLLALARNKTPDPDPVAERWLQRRALLTDDHRLGIPVFGTWITEEVDD